MITSMGIYSISLDGGATFSLQFSNLILNTYYNKSSFTPTMTLSVGSGDTPPELTDTALEAAFATSGAYAGFEPNTRKDVYVDRFEISNSRTFDLGVGHTEILKELGVTNGGLISRSLLKAADQTPTTIQLVNTDHLVIRYTLIYTIPRASEVFSLTINGTPVDATVTNVNGKNGGWSTQNPAEVIKYDNLGVAPLGTWSTDVNGDVIGVNINNYVSLTTNVNNLTGNITIVGTAAASEADLVGTFQQILITSDGENYLTAPILMDLDVPITKTAGQVLNLSVSVEQSA